MKYCNCKKWFETPLFLVFFFMLQHLYHNPNVIIYHNPYPKSPLPNICNDIRRKHSIIMFVWKFKHYFILQFFFKEKVIEIYNCNDIKINKYETKIMR